MEENVDCKEQAVSINHVQQLQLMELLTLQQFYVMVTKQNVL
jgi:hypothetical protein